jgi:hypothetical protein
VFVLLLRVCWVALWHERRRNWACPEKVLSRCLAAAPSPTAVAEAESRPKQVRFKVVRTPQPDNPTVVGAGDFSFEFVDECSSVENETGVVPHPDLQDAAFEVRVDGPNEEADAVSVSVELNHTACVVCTLVRFERQPTDAVTVDATGVICKLDE